MGFLAGFLQETLGSYLRETTEHFLQERLVPEKLVGFVEYRLQKNKTGCLADCGTEQESLEGCAGVRHVDSEKRSQVERYLLPARTLWLL